VGSRRSFDTFYEGTFHSVVAAARAFCGDADVAFESTQEAFARAYARWRRVDSMEMPQAWVMTTAFNLCRRQLKAKARSPHVSPSSTRPDTDRIELLEVLRNLPDRQRQAILLHYFADLPIAAVATAMNVSEGAVKSHLFKARSSLRTMLGVHHA
jgi:RNA polymerase sigma-70 factor, ECF subfamily